MRNTGHVDLHLFTFELGTGAGARLFVPLAELQSSGRDSGYLPVQGRVSVAVTQTIHCGALTHAGMCGWTRVDHEAGTDWTVTTHAVSHLFREGHTWTHTQSHMPIQARVEGCHTKNAT